MTIPPTATRRRAPTPRSIRTTRRLWVVAAAVAVVLLSLLVCHPNNIAASATSTAAAATTTSAATTRRRAVGVVEGKNQNENSQKEDVKEMEKLQVQQQAISKNDPSSSSSMVTTKPGSFTTAAKATTGRPDDRCDEACGWIGTVVAAVCYGSFGVPIKETLKTVPHVHPLVLQSYKSLTFAVLGWFVVLLGVEIRWTYWGLLSGLLWVLGGTGGVYGIRMAGIAVAVGTWASVMICVNFFWGVIIFQEPIAHLSSTILAFLCLGIGVVGMSIFSAPSQSSKGKSSQQQHQQRITPSNSEDEDENNDDEDYDDTMNKSSGGSVTRHTMENGELVKKQRPIEMVPLVKKKLVRRRSSGPGCDDNNNRATEPDIVVLDDEQIIMLGGLSSADGGGQQQQQQQQQSPIDHTLNQYLIPGLDRRTSGIVGAICNGLIAGSALIPLHYAKRNGFGGANFIFSFAMGSLLANIFVWFLIYLYYCALECKQHVKSCFPPNVIGGGGGGGGGGGNNTDNDDVLKKPPPPSLYWRSTSFVQTILWKAYNQMPCWHVQKLWFPGTMAGAILSIGMYGSVFSVTYLGQAVGNSCVQSKILISGLWGIVWYREITGCATIMKWFASASVAVIGILWLSHERMAAVSSPTTATDHDNHLRW